MQERVVAFALLVGAEEASDIKIVCLHHQQVVKDLNAICLQSVKLRKRWVISFALASQILVDCLL